MRRSGKECDRCQTHSRNYSNRRYVKSGGAGRRIFLFLVVSAMALEAENNARGDARLVLRLGVEVCEEIVDLDGTQGDKRQHL